MACLWPQTVHVDVDGIIVEGYYEVLALHKYLFHFKLEEIASEYAGSPLIAAIQHRLCDELVAADPGTGWQRWREAEGHEHRVDIVRQHLATGDPWWADPTIEDRAEHVRNLLAPLLLSPELVAELIAIEPEDRTGGRDRTGSP